MRLVGQASTWTLHFDQGVGLGRTCGPWRFRLHRYRSRSSHRDRELIAKVRNAPGTGQYLYVFEPPSRAFAGSRTRAGGYPALRFNARSASSIPSGSTSQRSPTFGSTSDLDTWTWNLPL